MSTKKLQIIDSLVKQAENADTLDGKHAKEFALASDVATLQTQVGDSSVSEQISAALEEFEASGAGDVVVDSELSTTSENPVQNKVVTEALNNIEDRLSIIPVSESKEEIFNQVVDTPNASSAAIDDVSLDVQSGSLYYITINGTTYQCKAINFNDYYVLTNSPECPNNNVDRFDIQVYDGSLYVQFSAPGSYSLVIEKPTYSVISIDTELSEISENPVQNKAITSAINNLNTLIGDKLVSQQIEDAIDEFNSSLTPMSHSWNGTTLTVTSASGTSSANLKGEKGDKGEQGIQGEKGADGVKGDKGDTGASGKDGTSVTVASISESTEDGGSNVVTFSDGKTITIKNGSKGNKGDKPQKGVDYFTDADQEAIVQQVITALGTPVFGRVDENNNIILSGKLADGTYTISYEDTDGNLFEIGIIEQGVTTYKNLADPSSADWLTNQRLNSSGKVVDTTPSLTTNYIPVKLGDTVRVRYMNIRHQGSATSNASTHFYDENKNRIAAVAPATLAARELISDADGLGVAFEVSKSLSNLNTVLDMSMDNVCYMRISGKLYDGYTKDNIIITVNQKITE